jgi:hypothetical protein
MNGLMLSILINMGFKNNDNVEAIKFRAENVIQCFYSINNYKEAILNYLR